MSDVLSSTAGHVGIAEIDRAPNNFFDKELIGDIGDAFDAFEAAGMRAIVLCAAGKNFCAGANFSRPAGETVGPSKDRGTDHLYKQALRLFRCKLPVVAAVQGAAVGGGLGLAMMADFRVADPTSRFTANFNRLGFHPGFGLSVTLPRAIGAQQAALLFYTGRRLTGAQAQAIGLADVLAPEGGLREAALALATEIAHSAPWPCSRRGRRCARGWPMRWRRRPTTSWRSSRSTWPRRISRRACRRWRNGGCRCLPGGSRNSPTLSREGRGKRARSVAGFMSPDPSGQVWCEAGLHQRAVGRGARARLCRRVPRDGVRAVVEHRLPPGADAAGSRVIGGQADALLRLETAFQAP